MTDETEHAALPVEGYKPQSQGHVDLVNNFKIDIARIKAQIEDFEKLQSDGRRLRWSSLAKTHLEEVEMFFVKSVFNPREVSPTARKSNEESLPMN